MTHRSNRRVAAARTTLRPRSSPAIYMLALKSTRGLVASSCTHTPPSSPPKKQNPKPLVLFQVCSRLRLPPLRRRQRHRPLQKNQGRLVYASRSKCQHSRPPAQPAFDKFLTRQPGHLSHGVRDLIPRLLTVDSLKRMTISELRQNSWFRTNLPM